jgi:hypothetical protein
VEPRQISIIAGSLYLQQEQTAGPAVLQKTLQINSMSWKRQSLEKLLTLQETS